MKFFTSIDTINLRLNEIIKPLAEFGILIEPIKDIPYGVQVEWSNSSSNGRLNLFHSKKKGYSAVPIGKGETPDEVIALFTGAPLKERIKEKESKPIDGASSTFQPTIGSDECGKGDFFGPLTTVAFLIDSQEMEREILALGVQDSKKISDTKIRSIAKEIRKRWPQHFRVVKPSVGKYNELYTNIGNLNILLGWMHGRAIFDLAAHWESEGISVKRAVIDKFADIKTVKNSVGGLENIDLSAIVRGEEAEVSIAAASVVARDTFLSAVDEMGNRYNRKFPLGASDSVVESAVDFVKTSGEDELKNVCKTHFKTYKRVIERSKDV